VKGSIALSVRSEIYAVLSKKGQDELLRMIRDDDLCPEIVTRDGEVVNVDFNVIEEDTDYIIQIFTGGGFYAKSSIDIIVPKSR
jgi:hypothetical protein